MQALDFSLLLLSVNDDQDLCKLRKKLRNPNCISHIFCLWNFTKLNFIHSILCIVKVLCYLKNCDESHISESV